MNSTLIQMNSTFYPNELYFNPNELYFPATLSYIPYYPLNLLTSVTLSPQIAVPLAGVTFVRFARTGWG
jgi:hypothetical protein